MNKKYEEAVALLKGLGINITLSHSGRWQWSTSKDKGFNYSFPKAVAAALESLGY